MLSQYSKPCFLPQGIPLPIPQYHHPQALVQLGICPLPMAPQQPFLIHTISFFSFFFVLYMPDHSQTIFQPAAFVSKQLYLLGHGLFSLALSTLCYRLSLSFGSKPYGT